MFLFLAILVVGLTFFGSCALTNRERKWDLDMPPRKASWRMNILYVFICFYLLAGVIAEQDLVVKVLSMAALAIPAGILATDWVFGPAWWRWGAPILRRQENANLSVTQAGARPSLDRTTRPAQKLSDWSVQL